MSAEITPTEAEALSLEFYSRQEIYADFTKTAAGQMLRICIDPRRAVLSPGTPYGVGVHSPGSLIGDALDGSIVDTMINQPTKAVPVEVSMRHALRLSRTAQILTKAHGRCAFGLNADKASEEMGLQSDYTTETLRDYAVHLPFEITKKDLEKVSYGSRKTYEQLVERAEPGYLIEEAAKAAPEHDCFYEVEGENAAKVYVSNFTPGKGVDRNKLPADTVEAQAIQAYHDNVLASILQIGRIPGLSSEERAARAVVSAVRSAATKTILTEARQGEMTFLNVVSASDGLRIIEQQAA